jgi:hypothetical protein
MSRPVAPPPPADYRDWAQGPAYPDSLGDDTSDWAEEFARVAEEYLVNLEKFCGTHEGYESVAEVRLAANRKTVANLLLGATNQPHDTLGLTFTERRVRGEGRPKRGGRSRPDCLRLRRTQGSRGKPCWRIFGTALWDQQKAHAAQRQQSGFLLPPPTPECRASATTCRATPT